jgi:hypothetical protein
LLIAQCSFRVANVISFDTSSVATDREWNMKKCEGITPAGLVARSALARGVRPPTIEGPPPLEPSIAGTGRRMALFLTRPVRRISRVRQLRSQVELEPDFHHARAEHRRPAASTTGRSGIVQKRSRRG